MTKIYIIHNKINNIKYIGQTSNSLKNRMKHHKSNMKYGKTDLMKAFNELGYDNFYIELIEEVDDVVADEREMFWILEYNRKYKLYNEKFSMGKCGGDTLSNHKNKKEISQKLSEGKLLDKNPHSVKVKSINLLTSEEKTFNSMKACQNFYGIKNHSIISKRCRGIIKKPYKNLIFKYI